MHRVLSASRVCLQRNRVHCFISMYKSELMLCGAIVSWVNSCINVFSCPSTAAYIEEILWIALQLFSFRLLLRAEKKYRAMHPCTLCIACDSCESWEYNATWFHQCKCDVKKKSHLKRLKKKVKWNWMRFHVTFRWSSAPLWLKVSGQMQFNAGGEACGINFSVERGASDSYLKLTERDHVNKCFFFLRSLSGSLGALEDAGEKK